MSKSVREITEAIARNGDALNQTVSKIRNDPHTLWLEKQSAIQDATLQAQADKPHYVSSLPKRNASPLRSEPKQPKPALPKSERAAAIRFKYAT